MWFIAWIFFSIVVGLIASSRGRSGIGFFFFSMAFSPLFGLFALLITKASDAATCPACKEEIKASALKCKHCGEKLEGPAVEGEIASEKPKFVICEKCEGGTPFGSKACQHCGARMAA